MAFLLELVPIIADAIGDAVASSAADAVAGAGIDAGAGAAVEAGAEAGIDAGADAGNESAEGAPKTDTTATGTTAGADTVHQAIIDGAVSFGNWAATQAAKQGLFFAGMKATEAVMHSLASTSPTNTPFTNVLASKIQKINQAETILHNITSDWSSWSTAHFANKDNYGSITAQGAAPMTHFESFEYAIGAMADNIANKVAPCLTAFNNAKTEATLDALRTAVLSYAQTVQRQCIDIEQNEQAMVSDGLQSHVTDIATALQHLSSISTHEVIFPTILFDPDQLDGSS
ncbi:hypothetical protein B0H63DRAFT_454171 [Podospora didyma]|uniref:Uncharacterized protein n=1 Tax=Podospora didyma TaxID=330526 RepID=A0AAE0N4H8_9PEZI|nr:hypothetical protein B0H63DRAFT_454171 [Podospora didyma]